MKLNLYFGIFTFVLVLFGCSVTNESMHSERKKPPQKGWYSPISDTTRIDTIFEENEKICFPRINFCFDSIDLINKFYCSENFDLDKNRERILISKTKTTNIYPLDLSKANDSMIIERFLKLLDILNAFHEKIEFNKLNKHFPDSINLKTSYFFDFSKKNKIQAIDTINYPFINETLQHVNLVLNLDMKIEGDENLNDIHTTHSYVKFPDKIIHEFKSTNEHNKYLKFDLKFIVNDKKYFDRKDYVPKYMYLN